MAVNAFSNVSPEAVPPDNRPIAGLGSIVSTACHRLQCLLPIACSVLTAVFSIALPTADPALPAANAALPAADPTATSALILVLTLARGRISLSSAASFLKAQLLKQAFHAFRIAGAPRCLRSIHQKAGFGRLPIPP